MSNSMVRTAIAGGGGFAEILALELSELAHPLIFISTREHPEFASRYDCDVAVTDYSSVDDLRFILQGVDLVISTISGNEQINLIDAARRARVRRFVPSEFEGSLGHRPTGDPLDHGSATALDFLRRWSSSRAHPINYTVFSCGVFYERLAPGGLRAFNIGGSSHVADQGDYLVDLGRCSAEVPATNAQGRSVGIIMTSAYDVAKFVAAAIDQLDIDNWPREFKMRGAQCSTTRLVEVCQEVRGVPFSTIARPYSEIHQWLQHYQDNNDEPNWYKMQEMLQTADGRYHFSEPNLNALVDVHPESLRFWLSRVWGPAV